MSDRIAYLIKERDRHCLAGDVAKTFAVSEEIVREQRRLRDKAHGDMVRDLWVDDPLVNMFFDIRLEF